MTNLKKMLFGWYVLLTRARLGKRKHRIWNREKLLGPFHLLTHPIAAFSDMKFEGTSSQAIANVLMLIYVIQQAVIESKTGWLFHPGATGVSIPLLLARTIGAALFWTVCNWAMCTLTGGEGKMREIWIALCYSLLPVILLGFIQLCASHVLSLDESVIYTFLSAFGAAWTLLLAFLGMMVVHQFTVLKTCLSVLYTAVCMVLALFLMILFFSIAQQLYGFIHGLAQELSYR